MIKNTILILKLGFLLFVINGCVTEPKEVHGCLDSQACNYNTEATLDNNSCLYVVDCLGDCGGDALEDNCGICAGNNESCIVEDYDGNEYQTVVIGNQEWMAENLKVTHYNNGDAIQYVQSESSEPDVWENLNTGAYGYYDDNTTHQETYGNLYNWYAVDDDRGVCPVGWHVPTDEEWTVLTENLGGASVAGGKMKEAGLEHWNSPNTGATNESGFAGLPSGYRINSNGNYLNIGYYGYFWSFSEDDSSNAWYRVLGYDYASVGRYGGSKQYGFSVRCVRN